MPAARSWNLRVSRRSSGQSTDSGAVRNWPSVKMPCSSSRSAVFGPTPKSRPTGSGSSVARTASGLITVSPSGLSISEASFASSLLCETPTEAVSPVRSRMRFLISSAMSSPRPKSPVLPVTSRKASSSESPSTRSVNSRKISNTCAGDLAVALEPRRHDDRLRAAPERLAHRHCGVHAEAAHLVARGRDDAAPAGAADDHRLAGELRPVALLDGRVERVHVHVQDDPSLAHDRPIMV